MNHRVQTLWNLLGISATLFVALLLVSFVWNARPRPVRTLSLGDANGRPQRVEPTPTRSEEELPAAGASALIESSLDKPQLSGGVVVTAPVYAQMPAPAVRAFSTTSTPTINLWYGQTQRFGALGTPQRWVNLLGDVQDAAGIATLVYALNGGPAQALAIGPDNQRLASAGDFNIELDTRTLLNGANQVVITATNTLDQRAVAVVQVDYTAPTAWPLPYTIDWASATNIQQVAQVVDGGWEIQDGRLRPQVLDYDRLVAIGDHTWTDYEVTVPVTIHSIDPAGYPAPSNGPGVGILTRWTGHFQVGNEQPRTGWQNLGALAWFRWARQDNVETVGLLMTGFANSKLAERTDLAPAFGVPYLFKMRVESRAGQPALYSFKFWPDGESEPATWDISAGGRTNEPPTGSILLVAHHADVSFGVVTVTPLAEARPRLTINQVGDGAVVAVPSLPDYPYGQYIRLAATGGPGQMLGSWSGDLTGNANPGALTLTVDAAVTAAFAPSIALISDDFNRCGITGTVWSFVNPLGDGALQVNGAQARISVPAGVDHDLWAGVGHAPRLMQPAPSGDFELEVKFDSSVSVNGQAQGLVIEQDADNLLRFDVRRENGAMRIFAGRVINGVGATLRSTVFNVDHPRFLRIRRVGDQWVQMVSRDGVYWSFHHSFAQNLTVRNVGVFAANSGGAAAPAHTATIDYFFTNAAPITPEDGSGLRPLVHIVGSGEVTLSPDRASYQCGETVTLTAAPAPGWTFANWSGSSESAANPLNLEIMGGQLLTATFLNELATATETPTSTPTQVSGGGDTPTVTNTPTPTEPSPGTATPTPTATTSGGGETPVPTATNTGEPQVIRSDDFNRCSLAGTDWQWVDPLNAGATYQLNGEQLVITVPGGTAHDLWRSGANAPRLMQPVQDGDFELEVKFESPVSQRYQLQGLLIEQDTENMLRINLQDEGAKSFPESGRHLILFAGKRTSATGWVELHRLELPTLPPPYYLRVARTGGDWVVQYSFDGLNWNDFGLFHQPLVVSNVGVFAGNAPFRAEPVPSHTALVDYFFDTAAPIRPEDGEGVYLPVHIVGEGNVTSNPACGNPVELTAKPQVDWVFTGWSGALTGSANPVTFEFAKMDQVTATFMLATGYTITIEPTTGGQIEADPPGPTYMHGQIVTLTAWPDQGWQFVRWEISDRMTGAGPATDSPVLQVTMPDARRYRAIFAPLVYDTRLYLPLVADP
jgi:regulation of enolase protein 1 (concanavalin A-like superfamily)